MSNLIASKCIKLNLLKTVYNLRNGQQQLNQLLKRRVHQKVFYEKTKTTPARYFTFKVGQDKFMELLPAYGLLTIGFICWHYYLQFNGVDYNEIINYKELKAE